MHLRKKAWRIANEMTDFVKPSGRLSGLIVQENRQATFKEQADFLLSAFWPAAEMACDLANPLRQDRVLYVQNVPFAVFADMLDLGAALFDAQWRAINGEQWNSA